MTNDRGWSVVAALANWIVEANGRSQHQVLLRLFKINEEIGEVDEAETTTDKIAELCDVKLTALVALAADWTPYPRVALNRLRDTVGKAGAPVLPKNFARAMKGVSESYIGVTGQNPRKGVTHTHDDVIEAVCMVVLVASVELARLTPNPDTVFENHLFRVAERVNLTPEVSVA